MVPIILTFLKFLKDFLRVFPIFRAIQVSSNHTLKFEEIKGFEGKKNIEIFSISLHG